MPHAEGYTEFTPDDYPSFPQGDFTTVELETISLKKLLDEDAAEQDRVFQACKTRGFFYLELAGCESGETIRNGADNVARVAERFFQLPQEEKDAQRMQSGQLDGYKSVGATVTDRTGTPDTAEFMNIAKNDMILPASAKMSRTWPPLIMQNQPLFNDYMRTAHRTGLKILSILATRLGTKPEDFLSRHRLEESSGDIIRMTRGPPRKNAEMPEIQTPSHTDFGSITLLMNWLGGLQVWSESARSAGPLEPDTPGEWVWVKPKRGHAIINLGDAAVKFTNGVLCSGRHRVVPAPGEQGKWPRYSIVYFVRPENNCMMEVLEGKEIPRPEQEEGSRISAREWIVQQAKGLGTKFPEN
ncbi:hypothetical protein LTR95_001191 [Oleoguttula sp. CCFEE 5521]